MNRAGPHVTFQYRKTYPEIEAGKNVSFAILTGSRLHNLMKLNLNDRELK